MSIYRERFENTIKHKGVDRCPIDLAGTSLTSVTSFEIMNKMAIALNIKEQPATSYDKFDERILKYFDIDFRRIGDLIPFETKYNKKISDTEFVDWAGVTYKWSGNYYEISKYPLHDSDFDTMNSYEFPDISKVPDGIFDDFAEKAKYLYENTPYVICAEHPVWGVLELACWLCGYDHLMLMMGLDSDYIHTLFSKILNWQKDVIKAYYEKVGKYIHFTSSGDDFGTQRGCFVSPKMFREFIKPYFKERIEYTSKFTDAYYWHHSCGAIFDIIPDLLDCGVKILNPIQPKAEGMDPRTLKEAFGDVITFHGGLDTQDVLPSNNPEEIQEAVNYLINSMTPQKNGGFIFSAAHSIQNDVEPSSVISMFNSARDYFKK